MPRHVADRELMDIVDGLGAPEARGHLAACGECQGRVEAARAGLRLAQAADVPEPPPLYWEAFRRQVERRITEEPRARWSWRWTPALAAAAALVALVSFLPSRRSPPAATPAPLLPAWSALPPAEEDGGLSVLQALASSPEDLAPVADCGGVADCVAGLSDEESRALAAALDEWKGRDL